MKTRIISGLAMLPFALLIYFGGLPLTIACAIVGIIGIGEFYKGFHALEIYPSLEVGYVSVVGLYAINFFALDFQAYMFWFFGIVVISLLYLFNIEKRKLEDCMATITGIFYVVFFSFHVTLVDQIEAFSVLIWLIFLTAFGTDIMAYFTGMLMGKHKLCPKISPKKTIEGSVGGILGSVILCGIFGYFFCNEALIHCFVIGALGGIVSQFGDLTASIFKRKMGIKDYGHLIPGHGGILDRFDSVLFTAPMVYYYIILIMV